MFKNMLRVAMRNFIRDKWYSLLNILGLTIGITFSVFLVFYIKDELSYDTYHENADRIFRINAYVKEPENDTMKWANTPFPMAPALSKDYPEVEEAVRLWDNGKTMFRNGGQRLYEEKIYVADSNLFRVFTHTFIEGSPQAALIAPNSLVLTQSLAIKYFGNGGGYVGKTLENASGDLYTVTAVIKDVPKNSHLLFNALISRSSFPADFADNWGSFGFYTYVLLKPNVHAAAFEQKLLPVYDKYLSAIFTQFNITIRFGVQPVTDIHLHSDMSNEPEEIGSMSYIYIFSAVAFFMLLIACINYMNLTTARSARRAKEIGIRKVTGSNKRQLVMQFLLESTLTALFALLLATGFIALFLPTFNTIAGKYISFVTLFQPGMLFILLAVVLFIGIVGGSYPAFYLAGFKPVQVLKGNLSKGSGNVSLRRILVVVQFSISMIMLICTWVVYGQMNYLRSKDLGFNKDQVMAAAVDANNDLRGSIRAFKDEVRANPRVLSVSTAQSVPGGGTDFRLFSIETKNGFIDKGVDVYTGIDEDFFSTLGIQLVKGRNFSGLADTLRSVIVNEKMAKEYGWGDNIIGRKIKFPRDTSGFYLEVIGVVHDFNQKSLYNPIEPLMFLYRPTNNIIALKLDVNNIDAGIASVKASWNRYFPGLPFAYTFLDQDFYSQYAADEKRGKIFTAFSVLTIIITCLGLLGLIAFTTQQRQKEISIRKVLGADISQLVPLITANFVALVGLSCFIAFPVAWYFMHNWLKIFPYNTGLSAVPFLLSAITVCVITLLTVSFHTLRSAVANPVKALKSE